ncbi:MAG: prepilin-type N-terminal cleavage/methylation domain-containing protein [Candidatus Portnoybacteria bacterium]|nr:prepilin-type N-terminal cleavage/methylation domain-containing protein [Candidatus Portnoybacteria bacterium]
MIQKKNKGFTLIDLLVVTPQNPSASSGLTGQVAAKTKGFTLIELLVVIAIIGLLSSIVLVSLNSARGKARDTKRVGDLRQMQIALEMYFNVNGAYPIKAAAINSSTGTTRFPELAPFMAARPIDPTNSATGSYYYYYKSNAVGSSYELDARMEINTAFATGDGGNNATYREVGTDFTILSNAVPPT